jgi:3-mercaptopyruvate sulfurtransferase SseA
MRPTTLRSALITLGLLLAGSAARAQEATAVPRIGLEEFKKANDAGKLLVIDVRSLESYRAGHIPGAISVPLSAWTERLPTLKASKKPIVAYCA